MLSIMCILKINSSVCCISVIDSPTADFSLFTATGDQQAPVHNTIGRAIVDACVRAGKEGRKFRVIIVIPSIPGFAGDLRQDAAIGTRAIMDYQYKSIHRGEHSIMGQIAKAGVDPKSESDAVSIISLAD